MSQTSAWNRPARQNRSSRTEQRILEATERLMAQRPFHEISISEIAQEAQASVSSLYARFPAKESLLGAVYERYAVDQQAMFDQVLRPDDWNGVSLAEVLRRTFPLIVDGYRARQGLLRAFLEQASRDVRFRETWSGIGEQVVGQVSEIVMRQPDQVRHPDPERGIRTGLGVVFATLAHQIQMHRIDEASMDGLTDELILMMLRYMGIEDSPAQ